MATIKAFIRTTKLDKETSIRFRLTDGRTVQLFYKSELSILPTLWDEKKEQYKARALIKNDERARLNTAINDIKTMLLSIYEEDKTITSNRLQIEMGIKKNNPEGCQNNIGDLNLNERLRKYIDMAVEEGIFAVARKKAYDVLLREMNRFLIINQIPDIAPNDFLAEHIARFRLFLLDEYNYVSQYRGLYTDMREINIPKEPRGKNTISNKLKMLQAFFTFIESESEILVSPFRKLGKHRKNAMMRAQYDEPFFLRKEEFEIIQKTNVPKILKEAKDTFLVQCAIGCRIGDYSSLGWSNIRVENGIPYISYLPDKTKKEGTIRKEIKTPLVKFAFEVIKEYDFNFSILKYAYGERGYNDKIKDILKFCKIDRLEAKYNELTEEMEYFPLYELASSKLARKTHVDMMNKVQINEYAAGLHKDGSSAVKRYTNLEVKDRFTLLCAAFNEQPYEVDTNYNIV